MQRVSVPLDTIEVLESPQSSPRSLTYRGGNLAPEEIKSLLLNSKKSHEELGSVQRKDVKHFYESQNELIDVLLSPLERNEEEEEKMDGKVRFAVRASMAANVLLFCMQLTGAIWSQSLSLISTTIDAFMDILSNGILLGTDVLRRRKNVHKYPVGKSRMEPVGIIVFASLMSFMSLQIMQQAASSLIMQNEPNLRVDLLPILLVASAIFIKICLYIYCRVLTSPTGATLAQDHRNDIVLNTFGLLMAIGGHYFYWWIDPVGGLVIAVLILRSWASTAYEQMQLLVGKVAPSSVVHRLTYIAMNHDPTILKVDTCRAFYVGSNLFVELDIVLPPEMPLKQTHDIGESLQKKLESLPEVERAFVHVDYEFSHKAEDEHKHPS